MVEGTAVVGGLVKALADHGVVGTEPAEDGMNMVHVSFGRDELDAVLVKIWEDEDRIHLSARWKPE